MTVARQDEERARRTLQRAQRQAAKEKLAALRQELRGARARRKLALLDARERCRADRLATREKNRTLRLRVLGELKETAAAERALARQTCSDRIRQAREVGSDVARARAVAIAEKKLSADLRRIEIADRKRRRQTPPAAGLERQTESDDDVRARLPSELWPLFDRVRHSIKAGPRGVSRTEVFLKYAEAHPDEVLVSSCDASDASVCALEQQERDLKKELGRPLNAYEAKKAARIERMRKRSERLERASAAAAVSARAISDHIPLGQPILVGHHSEKRHRRDIEKIHTRFSQSVALGKEAEALSRRADSAEKSRAVSSDDPDAIDKLKEKLAKLEQDRARMVAANKAVRSKTPREALLALNFSESMVTKLLTPDEMNRVGIPSYALSNASAEAARLRKRIAELELREARTPAAPIVFRGARIEEADNRVRIVFGAKPDESVRSALKRAGFRWSPTSGAWQRFASTLAWQEAKRVLGVDATLSPAPPANENANPAAQVRAQEAERVRALDAGPEADMDRVEGKGLDTTQIAERIRADIKEAVRKGELPKGTYSVRTSKWTTGSSIEVKATDFPFPVWNPDAFVVQPGTSWLSFDSDHHRSRMTDEGLEVERKLNAIVDKYHWDRSDPMTDYYNERFGRTVVVKDNDEKWRQIETARVAEARAARRKE